jgi:hypothetical protein
MKVRLAFDEPESGVTIIKLKQTDVPEEDRYGNSTVVDVATMSKGGPAKDELDSKKIPTKPAAATGGTAVASAPAVKEAAAPAPAPVSKEKKAKGKEKEGFKTIEMKEKFNCRSKDIYEILMDENRWKGFTQSNARISKEVGGQFSLFDGSITGVNEELQEGKLIVQKWRFGSWADGVYSTVSSMLKDIMILVFSLVVFCNYTAPLCCVRQETFNLWCPKSAHTETVVSLVHLSKITQV